VMPVWRPRREWLRAAVASALGQRRCAIELIVIDNGNDVLVADELADVNDDRLGGVSRARNAGLAAARGTHVRFLDCDDVFEPDSTALLLPLATDDATVAYGATAYCDADLSPYKTLVCKLHGVLGTRALNEFTVTLPSLLFPRRVVELACPWDEELAMCEDWDFVLRALEHARTIGDTPRRQ